MIKASKIVMMLFFISVNALTSMENSKKDILCLTVKIKKRRHRKESASRFNDPTVPSARKCDECEVGFKTPRGKRSHMTSIHGAPSWRYQQQQKRSNIVLCQKCGKNFSSKAKAHALFHNATIADDLKCIPCEMGYEYVSGIETHNNYHHESNHPCDLCDGRMPEKNIVPHKRFHDASISDDQKCTEHRLGFSTKNRYNKHVNAHVVTLEEANEFVSEIFN
jgi:hypothetical protein